MIELLNGCVCCSLTGEFKEAVKEILENYKIDYIVVETTGIAEPDALALNVEEIPDVELRRIITVVDAFAFSRYPLGMVGKLQIECANLILLNKADLVKKNELDEAKIKISRINPNAEIIETIRCDLPIKKVLE
jgi:G3E family GTPase